MVLGQSYRHSQSLQYLNLTKEDQDLVQSSTLGL